MSQIIECVPNFSEGRDLVVIRGITDQIETVDSVRLLDVDPGQATHRTVVTFAGSPEGVIEAAVRAARKASEVIDMRQHRGEHPRFGALDVCPLVPVAGISLDETVAHAHELARRLGEEVGLTIYCYEYAATAETRRNLADVRAGEYEGLEQKLAQAEWKPDYGPTEFNPRSGATAVGARDFLVAYNINLNSTSTRRANAVAFDVREKGRIMRKGDPLTGEIVRDDQGEPVWIPGSLQSVKAIGWYIEEYGIAQISMNLTNLGVTPVHAAFEEASKRAEARGLRVTGSELVGLIPLQAMIDAGEYFLRRQHRSLGVTESELIKIAVKSLGLDDLAPFDREEKIIEYKLADRHNKSLAQRSLEAFIDETSSESPAPGGGSVAAAVAALGAALGTMVANLSAHKRGWDDRWEEFSDWAVRGRGFVEELTQLVDEDTRAFNALMSAFSLPQGSEAERSERDQAIQEATRQAIEVPIEIADQALGSLEVIKAMAEAGNPASVSDAGVGALCARAATRGAELNVRINAPQLTDQTAAKKYLERAKAAVEKAEALEREILAIVDSKL